MALVLIGGVSAYLLISRSQQTRGAALSNSDNRAGVVRQLLAHVTAYESAAAADELATAATLQKDMADALANPATGDADVKTAVESTPLFFFGNRYLVLVSADGHVITSAVPATCRCLVSQSSNAVKTSGPSPGIGCFGSCDFR